MSTEALRSPSVSSLVWQQFRYQNKVFWRTPIAAFFTIVFPLMLLVLFTAIFGNEEIEGLGITTAQYFTPGLAVFAAVSATYTNLAIGTAIARDNGILKRIRGTPIPPWAYIAGHVASSVYLAFLAMALMMAAGVVFYGVQIIARTLPAALLTFVVGVSCFAALGMLVAAISPNGDAARDHQRHTPPGRVHLEHLLPDPGPAEMDGDSRKLLPAQGFRRGLPRCLRPHTHRRPIPLAPDRLSRSLGSGGRPPRDPVLQVGAIVGFEVATSTEGRATIGNCLTRR